MSRYALTVVDGKGLPHMALTDFHVQMQRELTDGAARSYLNALLPYFTYLAVDRWRLHRGDRWDGPPEEKLPHDACEREKAAGDDA